MRSFSRHVTLAVSTSLFLLLAATPGSAATGETILCHRADYGCLAGSGYTARPQWGSWGPGHNCVSYAAYRLAQNGATQPWASPIGNANQWDEKARAARVLVNTTPAVGSIAQWDAGTFGHIAYVEKVTSTYIEVSEDAYLSDTSGYSQTRRLARSGSVFAAAEFIHVRDLAGQPSGTAASSSRVGSFSGGQLAVKEGALNAQWVQVGGGTTFAMSPHRIAIQSNGQLLVKEGPLNAPWVAVTGNVDSFAVTDTRVGFMSGGQLYVKEGPLNAQWVQVGGGTTFALS